MVRRALVRPRRAPAARVVAGARALDLDDVGAQVGEGHRAERAGQHAREVGDEQAVQGGRVHGRRTVPSDPPCAPSSSATCISAHRPAPTSCAATRRCSRRSWRAPGAPTASSSSATSWSCATAPRASRCAPRAPSSRPSAAPCRAAPRSCSWPATTTTAWPARGSSGASTTAPRRSAWPSGAGRRHAAGRGAGRGAGRPRQVHLDYPGTWLADDVWATHGHYLDRHATVPTFERLGVGALARLTRSPAAAARRPDDYERPLAPLYALLDALAERAPRRRRRPTPARRRGSGGRWRAAAAGRCVARRWRAACSPASGWRTSPASGPSGRTCRGPSCGARRCGPWARSSPPWTSGPATSSSATPTAAGPGPQDEPAEWSAPGGAGGVRLLNAGCWVRDPLWGAGDASSPYRPGAPSSSTGARRAPVRLA